MARNNTLADVHSEKYRHADDAQSRSSETLLGEPKSRYLVSKRLSRAYIILLPTVFVLGAALGFAGLSFFKRPEFVPGVRLKTPIPNKIFQQRLKVPFVPDNRYYGSGDSVDKAWNEITSGKLVLFFCYHPTGDRSVRQMKINSQPPGGDSVWLQNPSDYNLDKGISDPLNTDNLDERFYVLSNLHQLHCVVSQIKISEESNLWVSNKSD